MGAYHFKPKFILQEGVHGKGVFATGTFKKGEKLFDMNGEIVTHPTRTSIQIGKNKHIEDDIGIYVNHHCHPTAKVNQKKRALISIKNIEIGDEITFDYNQNEDQLATPFTCHCCHKKIMGKRMKLKA